MRLLLFFFLVLPFSGIAQKYKTEKNILNRPTAPCTLPGMLPQTAIAVCGATDFKQNSVEHCDGQTINTNSSCAGGATSRDSYWYKFHCYGAGNLAFLITPDVLSDDYDWEIFDVTGVTNLDDVYTNESLMVSLNLCGSPNGVTGCRADGLSNVNCGGATNLINKLADLQLGHDYLLMVTNWSASGQGYTLSFNGGTASIVPTVPPVITEVKTAGCNTSKLRVTFSRDIRCATVTASGSEFSFVSGGPVITGVNSNCNIGFNFVTSLDINLQTPLAPGNYTLHVEPGVEDGNTFSDACNVAIVNGFEIPFTVDPVTPTTVTAVNFSGCAPTVLDVTFSRPVFCSTVSADGSEFSITPGTPAILSAQYTCVSGGTNTVRLTLQNPLPHGSYQLVLKDGSDGSGITDTCANAIANGIVANFVIPQTTTAPVIQTIDFDECHPDKLVLNFDKAVACATLSPVTGTEFVISPGSWPITTVTPNCISGVYTKQVILLLQNPLTAGNYAVNINNGTDGTTIADTCYAFTAAGYNKTFTATQAPPPIFDSVQFDKCEPSTVKLFYNHPIRCNSISGDGTDYTVTGPSGVTVASAGTDPATCGAGYTHWVTLQFTAPITIAGNYVVHNGGGMDGNGVIDTCSAAQNTTETIGFTVLGKPSAVFSSVVNWGCQMDTIVFSHPGGNGVNSWEWTFSDGGTASGQTVTHTFPITSATVSAQLTVSNGSCSDTQSDVITLGNTFSPAFSKVPKDTACINEPVTFTDESVGTGLQYLWDFGDGTQLPGQTVPPHIYTNAGTYTINLIVSDSHGCKDTASSNIFVSDHAKIDFTGLLPQYCTDKTITLYRVISPNITSYTWDNGNGLTFDNRTFVQFSYPNEGVYTITLTAQDKYCAATQVSKSVAIYKTPVADLGRDTVLCPASPVLLGVAPTPGYAYSWNTGAITSQILTDIFTRYYKLTIDNHGCKAESDINVKILPACLIKVPTAFTPNNDGLNDQLKAVNADLATNFSLQVFNRLGETMFKTNNPLEGWDGTYKGNPMETGTYVWQLRYIDPWSGKDVFEKGTSILIR